MAPKTAIAPLLLEGNAIECNPTTQLITIIGKDGKVILEAKRAGAEWYVSTNNLQPEDVQAFDRYQAEQQAKQQSKTRKLTKSRGHGGAEL